MVMAPPAVHDLAVSPRFHGCLLSSTGISSHNLVSHIPSIRLPAGNSSSRPGIAPQSLTPAPSCYAFQGNSIPVRGMYGCSKDYLILIPFRLPQISCFTPSLLFLLWLRQLPWCGDQSPASVPALPRAGPVLLTLLFSLLVPSSYWILPGSVYSVPLVTYSCPLSAGVLHEVLCLKVYSWCILAERCTPCPPTPPPSCSLLGNF